MHKECYCYYYVIFTGSNCIFIFRMKVPMPGSHLNDLTPEELRGDQGGGDSKREAEPSAPNLIPTDKIE